jgi:hypothetical protein
MRGRQSSLLWILPVIAVAFAPLAARADNFGAVRYDRQRDLLFITMLYRGTNPNHTFSVKWGECQTNPNKDGSDVAAEVLDDQFDDPAEQDFKKTFASSLRDLPCPRPVTLTLRTAPRFLYTLTIPK